MNASLLLKLIRQTDVRHGKEAVIELMQWLDNRDRYIKQSELTKDGRAADIPERDKGPVTLEPVA